MWVYIGIGTEWHSVANNGSLLETLCCFLIVFAKVLSRRLLSVELMVRVVASPYIVYGQRTLAGTENTPFCSTILHISYAILCSR